jgi:Ca-activated chloride channel family protein
LEKVAMSFGAPLWFWGFLALPGLVLLFVRSERKGVRRLHDFVSPRLLPQLAGTVNRFRRVFRFGLQLAALSLALIALAQPRVGYTFEDVKRKGIDLLIAVDTSRSMLSNDVPPNRLERVKLAIQDLIDQLQGDRIGLIAFAGRAFVQAPLTIDYEAVVEAVNDLDTKTIPEGGTNISEAITLADRTYGKSAVGNRALMIFTDGEELSGDAIKTAKAAANAGIRIFAVGVGTPEGSLIPVGAEDGGTAFVKDSKGQVVKSRLDEKRLREIAQATGGFYLHLENGPRTMTQVFTEGLAKMQAAEIDARLSRRPIERYEWPLGAAITLLAASILIGERKRVREPKRRRASAPMTATTAAALLLLSLPSAFASAPGLEAYRGGKFNDAYQEFQQTLKTHPQTNAADKLNFDSGAAAYKMKDYGKALESYSQALLSPDAGLQSKSHYNLGNTLYQRGEAQSADDKKLGDWTNALKHYEETLKLEPENKEAKENNEYVKKKIEELKNKKQQPPPPQNQKKDKQDKKDQQQHDQESKDQQQENQQQDQKQEEQQKQQSQSENQQGTGKNQKPESSQDKSQAKNDPQKSEQPKPSESPSPTPSNDEQKGQPSPSPGEGKDKKQNQKSSAGDKQPEKSPTPGNSETASPPSPSPGDGEGSGEGAKPSPTPQQSPKKKLAGEVKGAAGEKSEKPDDAAQMAETEGEQEGKMSERQAQALLQSMKDEEARVQLDERRATRRVYNDW